MDKREQLARKIVSLSGIESDILDELCVADLLARYDEKQLKGLFGFKYLMKNKDRYPDEWKKVCELLDAA